MTKVGVEVGRKRSPVPVLRSRSAGNLRGDEGSRKREGGKGARKFRGG